MNKLSVLLITLSLITPPSFAKGGGSHSGARSSASAAKSYTTNTRPTNVDNKQPTTPSKDDNSTSTLPWYLFFLSATGTSGSNASNKEDNKQQQK